MKIQMKHLFSAGLVAALVLIANASFAGGSKPQPPPPPPPVTFQTVDDFQLQAGWGSVAVGITIDPAGNVFVAGGGDQTNTIPYPVGVIEKSSDGGATWSTVNEFQTSVTTGYNAITCDWLGNLYAAANGGAWYVNSSVDGGDTWDTLDILPRYSIPRGIAADADGNVYVAGNVTTNHAWLVTKGTLFGSIWTTADAFLPSGGAQANAVFCHPTAGVFATGNAGGYWTTRRSLDGGATWKIVDSPRISGAGNGIGADAHGNIYVVGKPWTVRKSSDGGNTWTTVDSFSGNADAFIADAHGNLFVVGCTINASTGLPNQWIVRMSVAGTGQWQTVDTFKPIGQAEAKAIAADAFGHVYVAGYIYDQSARGHWVVRKD
jgi:hypothetical protein